MSDTPRSALVSFSEFEPVTTAAWQARIERDLKGADPATLRWNTPDGFALEPFYHLEALSALAEQEASLRQRLALAKPCCAKRWPWWRLPAVLRSSAWAMMMPRRKSA